MGVDLEALWDFGDPAASEARFRLALETATGDDELVLRTQVARTWSMRRETVRARATLAALEPALGSAGPEPRARYWLELGRSWISAVTAHDERTPEALAAAGDAYREALAVARAASLDGLAIDAIHMLAIVETEPEAQLAWHAQGLAIATASAQPAARRWEALLRNNQGMALHEVGRDEEALDAFRLALALRESQGDAGSTRVARWMVAWTLRHLGRTEEARDLQLRLEHEGDEAGEPDPYVFEELALLYRASGDDERADHYAARLRGVTP